ncbi:MAG: DUF4093 domain-containing protein [Clostridia bacterium]|nr:DUF4093 domain-containing protein [Clostridia bacterium]
MLKIKEAIIVEGRYDKNKLSQIVDTLILETSGFGVFNDKEKRVLFKRICEQKGVIILTDSDGAGFIIRNHLKGVLPKEKVKHAYIPQIAGKEKRKSAASKEGFLGVEGVNDVVIIDALIKAGATLQSDDSTPETKIPITKTDFYEDGLSGGEASAKLRQEVLKICNLPSHMTANAMLEAINILFTYEQYKEIVLKAKTSCNL